MSFWAPQQSGGDNDDIINDNDINDDDDDDDDNINDNDDYNSIESMSDDDDDYIDEQNIEEQIVCLKAEYAFQMSKNSQLQSELEKTNVRIRRRQKIIEYYDDYIFNYVFDDNNNNKDNNNDNNNDKKNIKKNTEKTIDIIDVDKDYKNVIRTIQIEETQRLEAEEDEEWNMYQLSNNNYRPNSFNNFNKPKHQKGSMTVSSFDPSGTYLPSRMRSKSAAHVMHSNILYQVTNEEQIIEKQWMRQLRKQKFKIFINKYRKQKLKKAKKESQQRLKELEQQITMKQRIEKLNNLRNQLEMLKHSRITFIQKASKELDLLRNVIHRLNINCT